MYERLYEDNRGLIWALARRYADGRVPVVVHRRNREPWLVTLPLEDWLACMSSSSKTTEA